MIEENLEDLTILLVEDDPGHVELVKRNFARAGISSEKLFTLDNGQRALDFVFARGDFSENNPGTSKLLMLLDLNMPIMGGEQVLEHLKSDRATKEIPVIVLTTAQSPKEVERCYTLGCNLFLTKPVDYDALSETLRELGILLPHIKLPKLRHYAS